MSTARSFGRGRIPFAALLTGFALGSTADFAGAGDHPAAKRKDRWAARMVDTIVNRNKRPKVVVRRAGMPRTVPLLPDGYDWKEDQRVAKSLDKLFQSPSVELWEELVRREHDRAYCITLYDEGAFASVWKVGTVCGNVAQANLVNAFQQYIPPEPDGRPRDNLKFTYKIRDHLGDWRKKRADKALYQLQIEVCEMALSELPQLKGFSKKDKEIVRKKIEGEIDKLRQSKKPSFRMLRSYQWLGYEYTPEEARVLRKAVKTGYKGDIDLSWLK